MGSIIKDEVDMQISDLRSEWETKYDLIKNMNHTTNESIMDEKVNLLKVEAHDARMTAYFLCKSDQYTWALG
ncbi:hypothetical protein [Spirochaeta cellobiosiphila]|uniref:hypothetical protein n=1 Tax=Spirochaeta cellobiosiphila TaxID=504483 RepID=UPI000426CFC8|nr:hypothetical protein [Spirochaeta cellobiosiphila]